MSGLEAMIDVRPSSAEDRARFFEIHHAIAAGALHLSDLLGTILTVEQRQLLAAYAQAVGSQAALARAQLAFPVTASGQSPRRPADD